MTLSSHLQAQLPNVPDRPGCYLFKGDGGEILYVGKAASLRSRVRSYFQEGGGHSPRTRIMLERVRDLETMVTATPVEALLLESTLIKRHRPHFNVRLRDDKQYPYICLTMNEPFPRPIIVRRAKKDGNRYFGPFTSSWAMRQALKLIKQVFQLRGCGRRIEEGDRQRLCLDYHMGLCSGPCAGMIARADYLRAVDEVTQFLEGKADGALQQLEIEMAEAAESLQFERAARLRDQVQGIRAVIERQRVVTTDAVDQDVVALVTDEVQTGAAVLFVRGGRLVGQEHVALEGAHPEELPAAMGQFLQQYYQSGREPARQVLLSHDAPDHEWLASWLRERRGGPVQLLAPQRGEKRRLVEMAAQNGEIRLEERRARFAHDQARAEEAILELQEALELPNLPYRIEAYDISNLQGAETVAAMVVFEAGQPKKADYRKFRIRTVAGPDDFAAMREALRRRLERGIGGDERFGELPDLILIDGGKGQLGAAMEVANELGVEIPTIGLAKQFEEVFLPGQPGPVQLSRRSPALFLLQRIRDEAHRFGLAYHRKLRGKRQTRSALDEIEGIGERRRDALLRHFGSVTRMKDASVEELAAVKGMNRAAADRVYHHLRAA
jgi:excinuclease ABC subunit C